MIENLKTIVTLVILGINVLLLIFNVICAIVKKAKNVDNNEEELKSENATNLIEVIRNFIPQAIEQAEKSGIVGGENKKLLALSQILLNCNEVNFDYKTNASLINDCLEELIEFSKKVNSRKEGEQ